MASQRIYNALMPTYKSITALEETAPWVGSIISNRQNTVPASRLLAADAGTSAICEHFTLTFTSSSGYTVSGFLSGSVGSGTITSDFTSTGGDLIISASSVTGMFSGTFASGDMIFISLNKWNRFISNIATYFALSDVLRNLAYSNAVNIDPSIFERYANHAKADLKALQTPYADDGYRLSTLPSRDFSDWQCGGWDGGLYDHLGTPDDNEFGDEMTDTYSSK
jgi:hypothetical protein